MKYSPVVPAVIPKDENDVIRFAQQLLFSREFHLDVVDGDFVSASSWPFKPEGKALSVKTLLDKYTLEVDLMVAKPLPAATEWVEAGADMLVFHLETISLDEFKTFAKQTDVSVGVSSHGETPLDKLLEYAAQADYVQLMGIKEIGVQGQPFDEAVLEKIATVKKEFPDKMVTIDGSVNLKTIKILHDAGADRFICGSAIVKQTDPEVAHAELYALING